MPQFCEQWIEWCESCAQIVSRLDGNCAGKCHLAHRDHRRRHSLLLTKRDGAHAIAVCSTITWKHNIIYMHEYASYCVLWYFKYTHNTHTLKTVSRWVPQKHTKWICFHFQFWMCVALIIIVIVIIRSSSSNNSIDAWMAEAHGCVLNRRMRCSDEQQHKSKCTVAHSGDCASNRNAAAAHLH